MDGVGAEVSQKIRSAIKAKLMELGAYVDEELPDYIMVMVANKRSREQMEDDLQLFLGSNTVEFTNWLHQVLQKLQEVTVASMERKRKSSANDSEGESSKKDKHKKSVEKKKVKKSCEQTKEKVTEAPKQHPDTGKQSEESIPKQSDKTTEVCIEPEKAESSTETQAALKKSGDTGKVTDSSSEIKLNEKPAAARPKIVLMQSDDDDDEDFINIKADAEAEALLDAELPKEAQDCNIAEPVTTETKQDAESVHAQDRLKVKVNTGSVLSRLGTRKVTSLSHETNKHVSPLLRVSNRLGDKVTDRLGVRKVALRSDNITGEEKEMNKNSERVIFPSERQNISVAHVSPTTVNKQPKLVSVKSDFEPRPLRRQLGESDSKEQTPRKRPLLSRVVAMNKEPRPKEEEEYDPANPAVGSVASVVRVKPRPKVPAALQANKNLILKAMAEAQKSVANAPKRIEPEERVDSLFTKKFRDSKGRDKIAITLPNRRMQPRDEIPVDEKPSDDIERIVIPVKLESTRSISSVNLQQKIVIQVSSEKAHETTDSEVSKYEELPEEEVDDADTKVIEVVPEDETEELKDEGFDEIQRVISCDSQDLELEAEESEDNIPDIPISISDVHRTESPQFVVTLDGLDPTIFNARKKQKAATIIVSSPNSEVQYEEKEREEIESPEVKEKRSASPILFVKAASPDTSGTPDATKQKINERCKYWPACRSGDKCDYLHPTVSCKAFPNCKFGDKCLYIHPNCKFDASCTRRDCPFTHASPRNIASSASVPPLRPSQQVCKFFPKCSNVNCKFLHPKMCRYGRYCNRKTECTYRHEEIPPADKLKWVCPFRV